MVYEFDVEKFKKTFKVNENNEEGKFRLTHVHNMGYKLFPFKAKSNSNKENQLSIQEELKGIVFGFFRLMMDIGYKQISFDGLCQYFYEYFEVHDDEDKKIIEDVISGLFFKDGKFYSSNLKLYPFQVVKKNDNQQLKKTDDLNELAYFLFCVFNSKEYKEEVKDKVSDSNSDILENIVLNYVKDIPEDLNNKQECYQRIYTGINKCFKDDLLFILKNGMASVENLSCLFSLYYFQYYVQSILVLDGFCSGNPEKKVELYYALDWERVSKTRDCCTNGWSRVKANLEHSFAHKTTLGILNNHTGEEKLNYIDFYQMSLQSEEDDKYLAGQIKNAEEIYISFLESSLDFSKIGDVTGLNRTERALKHLFECVEFQFLNTTRSRAREMFNNNFIYFCKGRWIKDRKKSGLVLNLTEQDIIFLTRLAIGEKERIRLIDLFKEFEKRGIYLDDKSKVILQEYFTTKLDIIDKNSDSGDAQYVRRIL